MLYTNTIVLSKHKTLTKKINPKDTKLTSSICYPNLYKVTIFLIYIYVIWKSKYYRIQTREVVARKYLHLMPLRSIGALK